MLKLQTTRSIGSVRCTAMFVAALLQFFSAFCGSAKEASFAGDIVGPNSRREGRWDVTSLGDCHDRFRQGFIEEAHRLVIAIDDRPAQLWDTQTSKLVMTFQGQQSGVDCLEVSPDAKRLLMADSIGFQIDNAKVIRSIWICELETGKIVQRIAVDLSKVGGTDWRMHWLEPRKVLIQLDSRMNPARASAATKLAYLDLETGMVSKWSKAIDFGEQFTLSADRKRATTGLEYRIFRSTDGSIGSGGRGTTYCVQLVNLETLELISKLEDPSKIEDESAVNLQTWSPDSRSVATARRDNIIHVWDGRTGKLVCTLKGHETTNVNLCFSPDGRMLMSTSEDKTARLWEVSSGRALRVLSGHRAGLNQGVFAPDGNIVATAGEDAKIVLWDVATGKLLREIDGKDGAIRQVSFAEDGKRVWSRAENGSECVWNAADGKNESRTPLVKSSPYRYESLYVRHIQERIEVWSGPVGAPGEDK